MNIFVLDIDPYMCARYHVDKHVVKMPVEYSQMLSTAHRILDGERQEIIENNKKKIKYKLLNEEMESNLYKTAHINHPCTIWVRENDKNYKYLYNLLTLVLNEYTSRYNKVHGCSKLLELLKNPPKNIKKQKTISEHPRCMPEDCFMETVEKSYRLFYLKYKSHILNWKHNKIPYWVSLNPYINKFS